MIVYEESWKKAKAQIKGYFYDDELTEIKKLVDDLYTDDNINGKTVLYNSRVMVFMRRKPKSAFEAGVFAHELFHAVSFTMQEIDISHTVDTEEAYAYVIQYVFEKAAISCGLFQ